MIQKDGRAYVDLQSLAEITNGSLSFKENRIVLSIRAPDIEPSGRRSLQRIRTFSCERFCVCRGISCGQELKRFATMREWASTMAYAIQNGYQITDDWAANYREQAANNLRLASAAASTEG